MDAGRFVLTVLIALSVSDAVLSQPRNLLTGRYSLEQLETLLVAGEDFRPYPRPGDPAWLVVPEEVRIAQVEAARVHLGQPWPVLPATVFLRFARDGDRSQFEALSFERRRRLSDLVLGEVFENRGRFLDEIANGIWAICEESFWGVPAHLGMQKAGRGLPDITEPTVDLFAAETASLLAWTWYLLGEQLDTVSPLLRRRIELELDRRILIPNLERNDFGWMGYDGQPVNNWNPWISSNWLATLLVVEREPKRRVAGVRKVMETLDHFLNHYPEDGGCDEGPGYWGRAGASLFDCLELLQLASRGQIDVFDEPLVANIGRYIYRSHIAGDYFVNFADASARPGLPAAVVYRFGKAIQDPLMMSLASSTASRNDYGKGYLPGQFGGLNRLLPALLGLKELLRTSGAEPLLRDVWLQDLQFMAARDEDGTSEGFYVAAKGGHNAESHNHNDVGNFMVYYDAEPVLIDVGVGTYTARTFSRDRYKIWTMQSAFHNLPTLNGVMQKEGREYAARKVSYRADERQAKFSLELAGAYPEEAAVRNLRRTLTLTRGRSLEVADQFDMRGEIRDPGYWTLLTATGVRIVEKGRLELQLKSGEHLDLAFFPVSLEAAVEEVPLDDPRLSRVWGDRIYRILFRQARPETAGVVRFRLTPSGVRGN